MYSLVHARRPHASWTGIRVAFATYIHGDVALYYIGASVSHLIWVLLTNVCYLGLAPRGCLNVRYRLQYICRISVVSVNLGYDSEAGFGKI